MNDTEIPNLDAVIYDLVKSHASRGGMSNDQIYTAVKDATLPDMPVKNIDATISWLRQEGMLRADGHKWMHIDFEAKNVLQS